MRKCLIFFCFLFLLTSCGKETINKESTYLGYLKDSKGEMVPALNTDVYLTTVKNSLKETMSAEAQDTIFKYHILLDAYHIFYDDEKPVNNICILNDMIAKGPITISNELFSILEEAITLSELSHGYFNPTIGQLSICYKGKFLPYESINTDPLPADISSAVCIPFDQLRDYIVLDKENMTVELKPYDNKQYSLDLGAISKGYTLDQIVFKEKSSFLLNAGASSIITHVEPDEEVNWNVAVKIPDNNDMLFSIHMDSLAISTSGDDENYYLLEDGTRRHHILNPYTGYPENYYRSIVLLSEDASIIDALSTAFFSISKIEDIENIIKNTEKKYNITIDYCLIKEESKDRYILTMNEGFQNKTNNDYNKQYIERIDIR